ncbi:hypothetical protein BSZ35_12450 [Salinibacter sp. 10B]|uniref:hypothetical protein n=1 Tax=Salinibacter sp. 10B TaxID=1923971 RepID=UPI000CF50129|nr:hypothetical protein [Salinibacter sp. 10B]PQJ35304.1 hypothetical protein BSZ35_12450 [Salinibacter sp. 10B]
MLHSVSLVNPYTFSRALVAIILLLSLGAVSSAYAQDGETSTDETLIQGIQSSGGYGAPTVALTSVHGEWAVLSGGQGGWILNRQFVIGGAGRGLVTRPGTTVNGQAAEIQMGYGGLLLEYIGAPSELVHYSLTTVVGGGSVQLVDEDYEPRYDASFNQAGIFVTEAGGRLELNVTSFFRMGVGGGYLFVSGSDLPTVSDSDLRGPYGELSLRFGSF